jgi:hypothetical protein
MTNTLHRFGRPESFHDDFVVFMRTSKGRNDIGSIPKLKAFLRTALRHRPVTISQYRFGSTLRPSENLNPSVHWRRPLQELTPEQVIEEITQDHTVAAIFDTAEAMEAFLREVKAADWGLSVNVAGLIAPVHACAKRAGILRHSVEYSGGFHGALDKLPERPVLELSTMCGHSMVSPTLARKMLDWVREGRRTPEQAAACMGRFCSCGIFNPARAIRLLEAVRPVKG